MKFKNFAIQTGWVLLYILAFYLVISWVSLPFSIGDAAVRTLAAGGAVDYESLSYAIQSDINDMSDILQLIGYVGVLGVLATCLIVQQEKSLPHAVGFCRPKNGKWLWIPPLVGLLMYVAVGAAFELIPEDNPLMQEYLDSAQDLELGAYAVPKYILLIIGAPVVEEILFRGLIYRHLKQAMPRAAALLVQALLFGLAHGQLLWTAFTFSLGLVLGLTRDSFDSLWPCIGVHLCFNAANYIPWLQYVGIPPVTLAVSLLLCMLLTGAQVLICAKKRPSGRT